ncbi:MAG: TIGR02452 family protein [Ruminococcaceae bacterium]|nr:TIGR02452 family protein [Oscillospiraceae bacterium]
MGIREELILSFQDTQRAIGSMQELIQKTNAAKANTFVVSDMLKAVATQCCKEGCVSVVEDTSFHAARDLVHSGKKTVVLNFASAVNPGGGVTIGAMAQEECLCRSSNLYPCLKQRHLMRDYYMPHRIAKDSFYSDKLIYTKNVTVFKGDETIPVMLPQQEWFEVDVITCAAPNMREVTHIDTQQLKNIFKNRIRAILTAAAVYKNTAVVLGAFGCGAFRNPPETVAKAFKEVIEESFIDVFESIVFAIKKSNNKNYQVFSSVFSEPQKEWTPEEFARWQSNNPYYGKKFSIMGDSISALASHIPWDYKPFYEGNICRQSGVQKPADTWWGKVISFFGGKLLVNNAYSGSRVTSPDGEFPAGFSQKRIRELATSGEKPDVIMVYLGFNDWANGVEVKSTMQRSKPICEYFDYAYFNMLIAMQKQYPNAEIWCLTLNPTFISKEIEFSFPYTCKGIHIERYNEVIRTASRVKKCRLVDIFANHMPNDTIDGSHPNAFGMMTLAQAVCRSVCEDATIAENEAFYQGKLAIINPDINHCPSHSHHFIQNKHDWQREYYCEKCGLSVQILKSDLETYRLLKNKYAGSTGCGEVINEEWFKQKEAALKSQSQPETDAKTNLQQKDRKVIIKEAEQHKCGFFCSYCGAGLKAGDRFCLKCGKKTAVPKSEETKVCVKCKVINRETAAFCKSCGTPFTDVKKEQHNKKTDEVPEIIDNRYKIIRQVGKGASSIVYLAQDMKLERVCAVKMIRKNTYADSIAAEESLNEANKLKFLAHVSIPQLYDIYDDDERLCIVMEYIEGKNLRSIVSEASEPLEEATLIQWAKQICNVLHYLHTMTPMRVFRDLKPANIILKPDGSIKLIDFGTMKIFDNSKAEDTVNLGTKGYAAPEQFGGKGATDARTDIYGFGMTMYHLITGVNPALSPFEYRPIHEIRSDISEELEAIVTKCIQVEREERYQSAMDVIIDLERLEHK